MPNLYASLLAAFQALEVELVTAQRRTIGALTLAWFGIMQHVPHWLHFRMVLLYIYAAGPYWCNRIGPEAFEAFVLHYLGADKDE